VHRDSSACHVAEIVRKHGTKAYRYYLLRRTYREDGKVKHQTLGNLSSLPLETIEAFRRSLHGEPLVAPGDAFEIVRTRPHGHVTAVLGTMRRLELAELIAPKRSAERDCVEAMIAARILRPGSKLATSRSLAAATLESTLGELVGVDHVDEDNLYGAMDWLLPKQPDIEKALAKKHLCEGTLALYDLTSTYFEGRTCSLARRGHSRDGKAERPQIVFGLLTNSEGCPVAVEVFEGNTGDPKTVAKQIEKLRERFALRRVVLVGDRGMITSARIREDLKPAQGIAWITALRGPAIRQLWNAGTIQLSLFDEKDLAEVTSPEFPDERLVACRNPLLATDRARTREELLQATERELAKIGLAVRRPKRPLRGKEAIALRVGNVIGRFKMKKHFSTQITDDSFTYQRNQDSIASEAALDGIYVVRTVVPVNEMATDEVVRSYKRLAVVERAFRSIKTVDLEVRPIHHHKADRVRAHVFLCMLSYYVEWHMRRALAPVLFDDEDKAAGEALRTSIVAPAQRSPGAERKAHTKRTEDDMPVHSFQTLLRDLSTIAKNRIRPKSATAEFDIVTTPTPLQQRALQLLQVTSSL
jgi:hypothetical protein